MNFSIKQDWCWPLLLLAVCFGAVTLCAQAPSWWTNRSVIITNAVPRDFSPVNQGQVKWLAMQAKAEFDEKLQLIGGAGAGINALVGSFVNANHYRPVNAGMLKNTVKPFYDRLWDLGLTNCYPPNAGMPYPWSNSTNKPQDFSIVNIGQTKYAFSFNTEVDGDGDGIPDMWEKGLGSNPYASDANAVNTNDWAQGLTNWEIYKGLLGLSIPNSWAIYSNAMQVAVVADIRSRNRALTVKAAEFFLDTTNGVTFGNGVAMSAMDGAFNSSNEMAQALLTPAFPTNERHAVYIHAQDNANHWCPFVTAIINPNVDDILNKVQVNYSAISDLQYEVLVVTKNNGAIASTGTAVVRMKGPYKVRTEDNAGLVSIRNENNYCWYHPTSGCGDAFASGINGDFTPANNKTADFFWDVPLSRTRNNITAASSSGTTLYSVLLTPKAGVSGPADSTVVDYTKGFVQRVSTTVEGVICTSDYLNPIEVYPGRWMFSLHRSTLQLDNGDEFVTEISASNIRANQGLADSLFVIPVP